MKYILVTGGVISGVGKGVIASSFGTILKCCNIHVTSIKIDPYINIDAGTFSPYEHGEVYVLDDGGEVDLDLGNYERFLDVTLHRDNNITTGKIYQHVINKERRGDYLGKTVQVVPHITDAIQEWVERVAHQSVSQDGIKPQVCIIELGGTIGDIEGMPFVEAFRQFQFRVKKENFCCAHVSLVPQPRSTGEPKTKPTQSSVRELRGLGLSPDLIVCRSENPIGQSVKEKISNFCHVAPDQVICIHDLSSIYRVPLLMETQGIVEFFNDRLQLNITMPPPRRFMHKWKDLAERVDTLRKEVNIALVGKYTKLEDSYASVTKALQHAAVYAGYRLNLKYIEAATLEKETKLSDPVQYHEAWQQLCKSDGVIVPGGFGKRGMEGKIEACQWSRQTSKPFLGICLGLQAAVIEFSRNVLQLKDANTTENDIDTAHPIVIDMPEHNPGHKGGTMRLGKRDTIFTSANSIIKQLYGKKDRIEERHRHRYEVNPKYVPDLEAAGMKFVGHDEENIRMEIMELEGHPYYVAMQYHPEYLSRPLCPSPPFLGLILASCGKLSSFLARGCRLSPRTLSDHDSVVDTEEIVAVISAIKIENKPQQSGTSSSQAGSPTVPTLHTLSCNLCDSGTVIDMATTQRRDSIKIIERRETFSALDEAKLELVLLQVKIMKSEAIHCKQLHELQLRKEILEVQLLEMAVKSKLKELNGVKELCGALKFLSKGCSYFSRTLPSLQLDQRRSVLLIFMKQLSLGDDDDEPILPLQEKLTLADGCGDSS